jgi:hypothetical protein
MHEVIVVMKHRLASVVFLLQGAPVGNATFRMTYEYTEIDGKAVPAGSGDRE